jgi:hypothetical protein
MDENAPKETPSPDFNKLDLSQLQSFSFGTQWTQDKQSPSAPDQRERSERPRRDDRRAGPGEPRRDRRAFPRADGPPAGPGAPERREFAGDRRPPREFPGGPRREGGGDDRGPRQYQRSEAPVDLGLYESPYFAVTFYPEDTSFNALAKTIRASCRTIELFEIARTVVGKDDRFIVVLTRKPAADPAAPKLPLYVSVPDGIPFETEEAAVAHVLGRHLGLFFDTVEAVVEAPKGNYQVINKCGVTGELLGPPNYHRYNQLVQQHYAAKISRMSPEAFRARIETVRDPEAVAQWLEKMKKITRYLWKLPDAAKVAAAPAEPPAPVSAGEETPSAEVPAAETPVAATPVAATPAAPTFDSFEEARLYLLNEARDRVVKTTESARFHGRIGETIPPGEIRRAIEGELERQRRFPLDTANALRGRLRREHFTIFKKGSKGVSYVCAVKRKFRTTGQTFSESIGTLMAFLEAHPMVRASELVGKLLGIQLPKPAAPAAAGAVPEGAAAAAPAKAESELTLEQREKIARMQGNLRWLVTEGYVTEFIDGRLFAPPPMADARKKEVDTEEHDPENFPDAPVSSPPFAVQADPKPEAGSVETPTVPEPSIATELPATAETTPAAPQAAEIVAPETPATPEVAVAPETPPTPEVRNEAAGEQAAPAVVEPLAQEGPESTDKPVQP